MDKSSLLVGLDIGTTSIKAIVADSGNVIGSAIVVNKGMRHGKIVDINQTAAAISQALNEIEKKTNITNYSVITGIPVGMLQLESASDMINIGDSAREVTNSDVKRALQITINSVVKNEREPIAFLPSSFLIDGKLDVVDPRKMMAHSLAVHGILLTAPTGSLHNIKKAIERAGYHNNFFVPTPFAIASVALSENERKFGSIILDFGGGVTTATVIHDGQIKYANIDFEGGSDISNDISTVLSVSKQDAEQIKLDYGFANSELASEKNQFPVNSIGSTNQKIIDEVYLSKIINARMTQIVERVGKGLAKHNFLNLPGGIIITGGNSLLQGTDKIVSKYLGTKTSLYHPDELGMRNPVFSAAYGIVNYTYRMSEIDMLVEKVLYASESTNYRVAGEVKNTNKTSPRTVISGETKVNKVYDRNSATQKRVISKTESKNTKANKGFKNFFKKFFD